MIQPPDPIYYEARFRFVGAVRGGTLEYALIRVGTKRRHSLLNTACGADLVTIHQGAGSGMGGSISAGHIVVADGSPRAADHIARCLHVDPGIGVIRHADTGYEDAMVTSANLGLRDPMSK